ncbi:MAG: Nramp family divalent metal transporter [Pseudomonadota bacterium]
MLNRLRAIGPGALAAAAFVGPGTVTTATIAGAAYGYALLWALVFATLAAIALQEMAARLGAAGRRGLGEAIIDATQSSRALRWAFIILIVSALFIGNAAYEGGNIAGAALGVETALAGADKRLVAIAIAALAAGLLFVGGYKVIERFLIAVVFLMTGCFAIALIAVRPDLTALAAGLKPTLPDGGALLALGLVGTTIVPYNLFLHAAAAKRKYAGAGDIGAARFDVGFSIGLGGFVSILILSTAAASLFASGLPVNNAADMARQLEPAFGAFASVPIAVGLFAAGLSSAVTAPLATAYAAAELFGFRGETADPRFRLTAGAVLIAGTLAAVSGARPVSIILFAQFANGLLLPMIGAFLLYAVNQSSLLGAHVNSRIANIIGGGVLLITAALGARALLRVFGAL